MLLAQGRIAYSGNAQKAVEFFDRCGYACPIDCNPADYFLQTLTIVPGEEEESAKRVKVKSF